MDENFEDEPMTLVRPKQFSGTQMVIENMDEVERKRQKRRRKRRRRLERLGKLAVCFCCAGIVAAIVVTIIFTEAAIAATRPPPPTVAPTPMPAVPTYKPTVFHPTPTLPRAPNAPIVTMAPVVPSPTAAPVQSSSGGEPSSSVLQDSYVLNPDEDTYIYLNGPYLSKSFGREDSFLVQNGYRQTSNPSPNAYGLLTFDLSQLPDFSTMATSGKKAVLKLYHQPLGVGDKDREPAPISVARLPSTSANIETLPGSSFTSKPVLAHSPVEVATDAVVVSFVITDLVFESGLTSDQLYLQLSVQGQQQIVGDRFYSRESDYPPELILSGLLP